MRNAFLQEAPSQDALRVAVAACTSAIRSLPAFGNGHHPAYNFLVKRGCCRFAQIIGITSDLRITFPYLLKIRASTVGLCALPACSRRRPHHSFERPMKLVARRTIPHGQPRRPDQTFVEPAAP
jgi:hypothetical protein